MKRLSSFSVILVFVVLSIIGAAVIPLLDLQYEPQEKGGTLYVSFHWRGASAKVIEKEVTSVIEGMASSISGTGEVRSKSDKGNGFVSVGVKNKKDIESVRFELASQIRRVYDKFPSGVSYPEISSSEGGTDTSPILIYNVNADMPTSQIERYAKKHIVDELSLLDGVGSVMLAGAAPMYVEVSYSSDVLLSTGVSSEDIYSALSSSLSASVSIGTVNGVGVYLSPGFEPEDMGDIPVKKINGRVIHLSDVTDISEREKEPSDYYRINGLNTILAVVYPEDGVNTLSLCGKVKSRMAELSVFFPDGFSAVPYYDSSTYLNKEIDKIVRRTLLSVLILLAFVYAVSRNFKYLSVISLALLANLLVSFALYVLFSVRINIYSMAGITVSLGIIIDMSIVMISHYGYYRNRKVFIALLAAQATTIGALSIVYLLPEGMRNMFDDFASVVIINLAVSLLISMFFIPALADSFRLEERGGNRSMRRRRRTVKFNRVYSRYLSFVRRHKWVVVLLVILVFGIPFSSLPDKLGSQVKDSMGKVRGDEADDSFWIRVYNRTLGSDFFLDHLKRPLASVFGGCISVFLENSKYDFYRNVQRPQLIIKASLPEGCTVGQLNEIVLYMENFLSDFDEIEMFTTNIDSYDEAMITVLFREDVGNTAFPSQLKNRVIDKASDFGGANWSVSGINQRYFNNNVGRSDYHSENIIITGYNYDDLYTYCQNSVNELSKIGRVKDIGIYGNEYGDYRFSSGNEYMIEYNGEALAERGMSPADAYAALSSRLKSRVAGSCMLNGENTEVELVSSDRNRYDVWNLRNEHIGIADRDMLFSVIGSIEKKESGNAIYKRNRQYSLSVSYEYVGNQKSAEKIINAEVERLNSFVLPVGYKAQAYSYHYTKDAGRSVSLLLLVIAIIFFVCSILFESLRYPLIIIGLIPISFIGLFLVFIFTGCHFDQGGFAALVMLSGLTVNAGIYLISEYRTQQSRRLGSYVRAFNHKIEPSLLTILSTVLGLIPFLVDGPDEVFWFTFALGTMGGLVFSVVALLFYLPIWIPDRRSFSNYL